jgi:hypothetical protein
MHNVGVTTNYVIVQSPKSQKDLDPKATRKLSVTLDKLDEYGVPTIIYDYNDDDNPGYPVFNSEIKQPKRSVVLFGNISITTAGTHEYTIIPTGEDSAGWIVDKSTTDVSVVVENDKRGHLYVKSVTYTDPLSSKQLLDTLIYSEKFAVMHWILPISVILQTSGAQYILDGGEFAFGVYEKSVQSSDPTADPVPDKLLAVAYNDPSGMVKFANIVYYEAPITELDYYIKEITKDGNGWAVSKDRAPLKLDFGGSEKDASGNNTIVGWTYTQDGDPSANPAIAAVTTDTTPDLSAAPPIAPTFRNVYALAPTNLVITAQLVTSGYPGVNEEKFHFKVIEKGSDPSSIVVRGTNTAYGTVTFTGNGVAYISNTTSDPTESY